MRRLVVALLLAGGLLIAADPDTKIDRSLINTLAEDADSTAPFFIVFGDRANLKAAYAIRDWNARGRFVTDALQQTANRSQAGVQGYLRGQRIAFTAFWVENKIYIPAGTLGLARALSRRPEVVAIIPEAIYRIPDPQTAPATVNSIEWNITKIRADQVWTSYTRGAGMVVANIDTGVQSTHPALATQYRGAGGSNTGNWSDPANICGGAPCDNVGHGSHTMGTMLGDDGAGNQIGVAPQAKWIACKGCETNSCSSSSLISCAQWILAPNNNSSLRPNVVNNSWGGGSGNSWYQSYVQSWVAAGIFPAFSNGNSGPSCGTTNDPGDYPESFAAGATDINDLIASFSSRGPSLFSSVLKPDVSAPGVNVRSSVPTNSYANFSGTSMASPHIAGTVALMWAAAPALNGNIGTTETYLRQTATVLTTSETCGGLAAGVSPNDTYGAGRIDAFAAVVKAVGSGPVNQPPVVTISSPAAGQYNCGSPVTFTAMASDPEDGALTSSIVWTDNGGPRGNGGSPAPKTYNCSTDLGNHNIVASVTDSGGATDTDTRTITIVDPGIPAAPSNLTATLSGSTVNLTWTDNSSTEDGFKVERKKSGGSWVTAKTVAANTTTATDTPGKGNWSYRVRATLSGHADSNPSNVVNVKLNH
jgi:subtilisin family serine protease